MPEAAVTVLPAAVWTQHRNTTARIGESRDFRVQPRHITHQHLRHLRRVPGCARGQVVIILDRPPIIRLRRRRRVPGRVPRRRLRRQIGINAVIVSSRRRRRARCWRRFGVRGFRRGRGVRLRRFRARRIGRHKHRIASQRTKQGFQRQARGGVPVGVDQGAASGPRLPLAAVAVSAAASSSHQRPICWRTPRRRLVPDKPHAGHAIQAAAPPSP